MKIVCIFAEELFAIHYPNQDDNEYDRLMDLWTDVSYLRRYAKQHNIPNINSWVQQRLQDAEEIDDKLDELSTNSLPLDFYFQALHNNEYRNTLLSPRKGRLHKNGLRIYAIKVHDNCFLITGGAIKMSDTMQEHEDTLNELVKLERARTYLKNQNIVDDDSFYELLTELE